MIAIITSENYSKNCSHMPDNTLPCVICGKAIKTDKIKNWVHVVNGGISLLHPNEEPYNNPSDDMLYFPIGSDCLKNHPEYKSYVHKINGNKNV